MRNGICHVAVNPDSRTCRVARDSDDFACPKCAAASASSHRAIGDRTTHVDDVAAGFRRATPGHASPSASVRSITFGAYLGPVSAVPDHAAGAVGAAMTTAPIATGIAIPKSHLEIRSPRLPILRTPSQRRIPLRLGTTRAREVNASPDQPTICRCCAKT